MKKNIILLFLTFATYLSYSADVQSKVDKWDDLLMDFGWIYSYSTSDTFVEQPFYYTTVSNGFLIQTNVVESFKYFEKEKNGHKRYWDKFSLYHYLNAIIVVINKAGRNDNVYSGGHYVNSKITSGSQFYDDPETLFEDAEEFFLFRDVPATEIWPTYPLTSIQTNAPIVYLKLCPIPNPVIFWQEGFKNSYGTSFTHYFKLFANYANNKAFSIVSTNDDYSLEFSNIKTNKLEQSGILNIKFYDKVDMQMSYTYLVGDTLLYALCKTPYAVDTNVVDYYTFPYSGLYNFSHRTNINYDVTDGTIIDGSEMLYFDDVHLISGDVESYYLKYKTTTTNKFLCLNLSDSSFGFDNSANIIDEALVYSNLNVIAQNMKTSLAYYKVPAGSQPFSRTRMYPHYYHNITSLTSKKYYGEGRGATVSEAWAKAFSVASTNFTVNNQYGVQMNYLIRLNPFGGEDENCYASIDCTVTEDMTVKLNPWYPSSYTNMLNDYVYDVDVFFYNNNSSSSGDYKNPDGIWYNLLDNRVYQLDTSITNLDAGIWYGSTHTNTLDSSLKQPTWINDYLSITDDSSYIRVESHFESIGVYFTRKKKE